MTDMYCPQCGTKWSSLSGSGSQLCSSCEYKSRENARAIDQQTRAAKQQAEDTREMRRSLERREEIHLRESEERIKILRENQRQQEEYLRKKEEDRKRRQLEKWAKRLNELPDWIENSLKSISTLEQRDAMIARIAQSLNKINYSDWLLLESQTPFEAEFTYARLRNILIPHIFNWYNSRNTLSHASKGLVKKIAAQFLYVDFQSIKTKYQILPQKKAQIEAEVSSAKSRIAEIDNELKMHLKRLPRIKSAHNSAQNSLEEIYFDVEPARLTRRTLYQIGRIALIFVACLFFSITMYSDEKHKRDSGAMQKNAMSDTDSLVCAILLTIAMFIATLWATINFQSWKRQNKAAVEKIAAEIKIRLKKHAVNYKKSKNAIASLENERLLCNNIINDAPINMRRVSEISIIKIDDDIKRIL